MMFRKIKVLACIFYKNFIKIAISGSLFIQSAISQSKQTFADISQAVNTKYDESGPVISADGKKLYFFRTDYPTEIMGKKMVQDIWYTEMQSDSTWILAKRLSKPFNNQKFNTLFYISPDNNIMLIAGVYKGWKYLHSGLSITHKTNKGWSPPKELKIKNFKKYNKGLYYGAYLSTDRNKLLLFMNEQNNEATSDLYISFRTKKQTWSEPLKLPDNINTPADEFAPCLAVDDKTLYFSSNRKSSLGSSDIFMTRRLDDTWLNWSNPINLGTKVNTRKWDAYLTTDFEGKMAYIITTDNTLGKGDIKKIKLTKDIAPLPVHVVHGKIVFPSSIIAKTNPISIIYHPTENKRWTTEIFPDPLNNEYLTIFPLEKPYVIYAFSERYFGMPIFVNDTLSDNVVKTTKDIHLKVVQRGQNFIVPIDKTCQNSNQLSPNITVYLDLLIKIWKANPSFQLIMQTIDNENSISIVLIHRIRQYLIDNKVGSSKIIMPKEPVFLKWSEKQLEKERNNYSCAIAFILF